jgi:hypothetical protein
MRRTLYQSEGFKVQHFSSYFEREIFVTARSISGPLELYRNYMKQGVTLNNHREHNVGQEDEFAVRGECWIPNLWSTLSVVAS